MEAHPLMHENELLGAQVPKQKRRPEAALPACRCANQSVFPGYLSKRSMPEVLQKNTKKILRREKREFMGF